MASTYLLARTCSYDRMNVQRGIARGIMILGILVLAALTLGIFTNMGVIAASPLAFAASAAVPLVLAVIVFVVGLRYEMLAAALLGAGIVAFALWGIFAAWEAGVWLTMLAFVFLPMIVAAGMYLYAAQTQQACELEESGKRPSGGATGGSGSYSPPSTTAPGVGS